MKPTIKNDTNKNDNWLKFLPEGKEEIELFKSLKKKSVDKKLHEIDKAHGVVSA